ncbi:hypothetical protein NL676_001430 [Syzygium grande]|nr:hypothetical protein NL676_001430 [Syzygium grande]
MRFSLSLGRSSFTEVGVGEPPPAPAAEVLFVPSRRSREVMRRQHEKGGFVLAVHRRAYGRGPRAADSCVGLGGRPVGALMRPCQPTRGDGLDHRDGGSAGGARVADVGAPLGSRKTASESPASRRGGYREPVGRRSRVWALGARMSRSVHGLRPSGPVLMFY